MNTTLWKTKIAVMACLLAMAMFNVAAAHRNEGGDCASCHDNPGGSLTASPNPFGIKKGSTGLLTFSISSLGGSSQTAISVQGLENPLLNASIAPGGNTWTHINGDSGQSYVSNTITSTGPYTLNLAIGSLATLGTYPIVVEYAGSGARSTTTGFNLQVMMAALAGDYNNNGFVDAADYTVWRNTVGTDGRRRKRGRRHRAKRHAGRRRRPARLQLLEAALWRRPRKRRVGLVPEPAAWVIVLLGAAGLLAIRDHRLDRKRSLIFGARRRPVNGLSQVRNGLRSIGTPNDTQSPAVLFLANICSFAATKSEKVKAIT